MKEHLKKLYEKNKRHWEVWVWLWMQSDTKNSTIFTYRVICARFNVPKSTFARVIESQSVWNDEKIISKVEKLPNCKYRVTFYPKGKKATKHIDTSLEDELFAYVKDAYKKKEYDYPNINKHKIYITRILVQIEKAMKTRGTEITYETKSDTFKMFFTSIPQWWVDNSYSLNSINKNFATIINQIKTNGKGNNFKKAIRETTDADYSDIAKR